MNLGRVTVVVKHTPRGGCAGTSGSWCRTHSTYLASGKTNTYGNYRFNFRVSGPDSYIAYTTNPYYLNAYYRTYKLIPYYYEVAFGASSGHTVHLNWAYRG